MLRFEHFALALDVKNINVVGAVLSLDGPAAEKQRLQTGIFEGMLQEQSSKTEVENHGQRMRT